MDRSVCQKSLTPQLPCVGIMEMIGQCWKWTFLPVHIPFPSAHLSFPRLNNGIVELYCCEPHAKVGISAATCTASGGKCSALSVWISNAFSVGQSASISNLLGLIPNDQPEKYTQPCSGVFQKLSGGQLLFKTIPDRNAYPGRFYGSWRYTTPQSHLYLHYDPSVSTTICRTVAASRSFLSRKAIAPASNPKRRNSRSG